MNDGPEIPAVRPSSSRRGGWNEVWDWVKALVVAVLIAWGIHQFLFQQYVVDGRSMVPALQNGDRLLVDKIPYDLGPPKRGDVIVFRAPAEYAGPQGEYWVKRVIGLPGDTVAVKHGHLILDGRRVPETFINGPMDPSKDSGPFKVPPGTVFVMGDNRNLSFDSRYVGPIADSQIVGRVDLLFWPLSQFRVIGTTGEKWLPQGPVAGK